MIFIAKKTLKGRDTSEGRERWRGEKGGERRGEREGHRSMDSLSVLGRRGEVEGEEGGGLRRVHMLIGWQVSRLRWSSEG